MHPEVSQVAFHMRDFGLTALGRAVFDATFAEMLKPAAHAMSVVIAAQAGEILVKARIAEEHPLLIFDALPSSRSTAGPLTLAELLSNGKTTNYSELPELLWAATGHRVSDVRHFTEFGKLRNTIMHFAIPNHVDLTQVTLKYAFELIDPLVNEFWGDTVVNYVDMWDDAIVSDGYLQEQLERCGVVLTDRTRQAIDERTRG
jgi:hypothetical protein